MLYWKLKSIDIDVFKLDINFFVFCSNIYWNDFGNLFKFYVFILLEILDRYVFLKMKIFVICVKIFWFNVDVL